MKTLRVAPLVLAAAMSLGIHGYASTSEADLSAQKVEQTHKHCVAEIAALQKQAETATQDKLAEKSGHDQPWYEAQDQAGSSSLSTR